MARLLDRLGVGTPLYIRAHSREELFEKFLEAVKQPGIVTPANMKLLIEPKVEKAEPVDEDLTPPPEKKVKQE